MTLKIALTGAARSGKGEVERILCEDYGFTAFAFASGVKDGFHKENPHIPRHPKPRRGYILYGQYKRYTHGEDYWIREVFNKIYDEQRRRAALALAPLFPVLGDVRQRNEYDRCRAEGYTIIRVEADDVTRLERMRAAGDRFNIDDLKHDTETQLDAFEADYVINNGAGVTLDDLKRQVDAIMGELITQSKRVGAGRVR
ncbi:dephospho-CoA kinase [Shouchella rhizosphaerae]|uniref:Dephospho-CoA kinase n=1 Tax=Shouchella rhizosphaerae TaxID=866786 RepID=A0ABZ2CT58_9BACI|nr:dephospho-CoA kinase [Psychrobacillus sp. MER TA 17]